MTDHAVIGLGFGTVYQIENTVNKDIYIGSSVDFVYRKWCHKRDLRNNKHHSPILQNSWNKYGEKVFLFTVIETVEKRNLIEKEQYWMDSLKPRFNCSPTAGSPLGVKHTAKARKNMSEAHKGKTLKQMGHKVNCPWCRNNKGEAHWNFGKIRPLSVKDKISKKIKKYRKTHKHHQKRKPRSERVKSLLRKKNLIPILQYSLDGVFIKEWDGITIAAKELKMSATSIIANLKGRVKQPKIFRWEYKVCQITQ